MLVEGTRYSVLRAVADIQNATSLAVVEDAELAAKVDLDLSLIRSALNDLAQAGYLELDKTTTLSGLCYTVAITPEGRTALQEAHQKIGEQEPASSGK
jgi:DNA-binding MarR family transcriptional regulator